MAAFNPDAGEFVPGQWGAPATPPLAQPTPPPKESWDEDLKEDPVPAPSAATATAGPTTSTLKLDEDDVGEDPGPEDEEEKAKAVERKLKKLDWGTNDAVDPREHLNIVFIGHVGMPF